MTSTSVNVGLADGRNSSKVLKPPGGGTSDLFASPPDQADSPRKMRASNNLILGDASPIGDAEVPVYKSGNDTRSRLFGDIPPPRTRHAYTASNMPWLNPGTQEPAKYQAQPKTVKKTDEVVEKENNGFSENTVKAGGNPVTGEGYETGKSNEVSPQNGNPPAPVLRNRVPPGGYSSGLW